MHNGTQVSDCVSSSEGALLLQFKWMFAIRAERAGRAHKTPDNTLLQLASMVRACGRLRIYISTRLNSAATHVSTSPVLCELDLIDQTAAQMALISFSLAACKLLHEHTTN